MATTPLNLAPSNYGRYLALNRALGNPMGLTLPTPTDPLYVALFFTTADPDIGFTQTEVNVPGYSRQLYRPVAPFKLSDGGTYNPVVTGTYLTRNSAQVTFGPLLSGGIVLKGVALVDTPVRGTGHILGWANFLNWPTPASGDTVYFPANTLQFSNRRGLDVRGAAPGLISNFLSQQLCDVAYDGGTPLVPDLHIALYQDQGQQNLGRSSVDPDAYPQPVPNVVPLELSDPGYSRQPFAVSNIALPTQDYGDLTEFCHITAELTLFGPFSADQQIGGFCVVNNGVTGSPGGICASWADYHEVSSGAGVTIDGRTGWKFAL